MSFIVSNRNCGLVFPDCVPKSDAGDVATYIWRCHSLFFKKILSFSFFWIHNSWLNVTLYFPAVLSLTHNFHLFCVCHITITPTKKGITVDHRLAGDPVTVDLDWPPIIALCQCALLPPPLTLTRRMDAQQNLGLIINDTQIRELTNSEAGILNDWLQVSLIASVLS